MYSSQLRQRFVPILDRAVSGQLSTAVQCSTCPSVAGAGADKVVEKLVEHQVICEQKKTTVAPAREPTAATPDLSSGQFTHDWLNAQMMRMMRNVDGQDALHLHVEEKYLQLIAQDKYVELARLLKEDKDEDRETELEIVKEGVTFNIPGTKRGRKIRGI